MSANIWTQCGATSNLRALRAKPWRVVEAQHLISTLKLVSTLEEQRILEELIEGRVHNRIVVPEDQKHWTRIALDRMLSIR